MEFVLIAFLIFKTTHTKDAIIGLPTGDIILRKSNNGSTKITSRSGCKQLEGCTAAIKYRLSRHFVTKKGLKGRFNFWSLVCALKLEMKVP